MSTEDQNRCVVTVHKGVDVDALMEEITSLGGTTPHVPQRTVEMWNEKQDSLYNFDVVLTRDEAEILKQDPRIIDVRYGSKEENGINERANKEVIRHLKNIVFEKRVANKWSKYLPLVQRNIYHFYWLNPSSDYVSKPE